MKNKKGQFVTNQPLLFIINLENLLNHELAGYLYLIVDKN